MLFATSVYNVNIAVWLGNAYPAGLYMQSFQNATPSTKDGETWYFSSNTDTWTEFFSFYGTCHLLLH